MRAGNTRSIALSLCALLQTSLTAFAAEVVLVGGVDGVSPSGGQIAILGHEVTVSSRGVGQDARFVLPQDLENQFVVVASRQADGSFAAEEIRISDAAYVPGASVVHLVGQVTKADFSAGHIWINGACIYIGDVAHDLAEPVRVGQVVKVKGVQAMRGGLLWASGLIVSADESLVKQDLLAEIAAVSGGEADASARPQSITGTGIQRQSITGTGILRQSITGTGSHTQSITGNELHLQSITGTGIQRQSITGTGILRQSITGTGVQTQSITGTGAHLQSITGTGIRN